MDSWEEVQQAIETPEHTFDMAHETPVEHRFDRIVGNELRCSLHGGVCASIFISPTEVLEMGDDGRLHLVDKA